MNTKVIALAPHNNPIITKAIDQFLEAFNTLSRVVVDEAAPEHRGNILGLATTLTALKTRYGASVGDTFANQAFSKLMTPATLLEAPNIQPYDNNFRPTWDEYFMFLAGGVSLRSSCFARKVGAVIVKDKRIISSGYNGAPQGMTSCYDRQHSVKERFKLDQRELHKKALSQGDHAAELQKKLIKKDANDRCIAVHAEKNAIFQLANSGEEIGPKPTSLYVTLFPCHPCAESLASVGIKSVYYMSDYANKTRTMTDNQRTISLFQEKAIEVKPVIIRPEAMFTLLFNFTHPGDIARELIKPGEIKL
jgi:dCMP deaminase